jgi:hypothetical protein
MVEPIVVAFGTALVAAMATDTWEEARSAVVALWRRACSPRQAKAVAQELGGLRERVLAARAAGQTDIERALERVWQGRLQELLLDNPDLASEFRAVMEQTMIPMLLAAERSQINMFGSSHGTSTFNQVAGNQTNLRS